MHNLAEAANSQNEEVKKISAWAAILFAPTLIGTIYGMKFVHVPELDWILGSRVLRSAPAIPRLDLRSSPEVRMSF